MTSIIRGFTRDAWLGPNLACDTWIWSYEHDPWDHL